MKKLIVAFLFLLSGSYIAFQVVFDVPESPLLMIRQPHGVWQKTGQCYQSSPVKGIDNQGTLQALVWNIYKENRPGWQQELNHLSDSASLVLLQESSLKDEFTGWLDKKNWVSTHVSAFDALNVSAGVINLSRTLPQAVCAYTQMEPWLRLPKSALFSLYPLSDGRSLAVINVHAVNFTLGIDEYSEQLQTLRELALEHTGPVLVAGDFNSWSSSRTEQLREDMGRLGLKEVHFEPDHRTEVLTGYKLDHLFFRGMELIKAEAPMTSASDHNPLVVSFRLAEPLP
ncbi:endonuclease/exonuclease/phosphatase family protein [Vibrio albus]|uniref:Endonuclease/exonuclease/phosphatase family protein n=1 Tax=Vibrio albus TaxID=2200953 RepID=A0A2U3BCJ6_9VIBR|nr:endonuclease/exonuclease/phosphatase family protein [Vibrio albus]PWI34454.1 endonuclease/exonuclease/phosphatase family protein [Vibrio albus]